MEGLIGKILCLLSDARLGSRADIAAIAENLLRITGEDLISAARKFKADYTARLLARIIVLANEVPTFRDAASALPSRFVILKMNTSFIGREDHQLEAKLTAELPGILRWALDGLQRLRQRGHFTQPRSGKSQVDLMQALASPISVFISETCVVEPGGEVPRTALYRAWRDWCRDHGRDQPGTEQSFGRDIAAAVPDLRHHRPRVNGERIRMYAGLRLRTPDDPAYDDDDEGED
jgi:putative DNA primase/helicase